MPKKTIDEIICHIMKNGGPDADRKAHPKNKRVRYSDLEKALSRIHSRGQLSGVKAYHFDNVYNIWNKNGWTNRELGREMLDEAMQKLILRYDGNLIDAIKNISQDDFYEKLELRTKSKVIKYDIGSMFQLVKFDLVHTASPYAAVKYWIGTHPEERIRREYDGLKPWHLTRVSRDLWAGEEGKARGSELTGELINALAARYGGISRALMNLTAERFENEKLEFTTSDGKIFYDLNGMFQRVKFDDKHIRHVYAATVYWMDTSGDNGMKERYAGELEIIKSRSERHRA
jgi:hypothetical protein